MSLWLILIFQAVSIDVEVKMKKSALLKASMLLAFTACNDEANFQGATPTVAPPVTVSPTQPICELGEKPNDMRIAFLVDVSGSNGQLDCKDPQRTAFGTTTCASTEREASMNTIFDSLNDYNKNLSGTKPSINFALATYPTQSNQKSGAEVQLGWTEVNDANRFAFTESTKETRNPMGWTPLDAGLKVTRDLFAGADLNSNEDRILTIITDGEQTVFEQEASDRYIAEMKTKYNLKSVIVLKLPDNTSTNGVIDPNELKQKYQSSILNYIQTEREAFWLNGPTRFDSLAFDNYFEYNSTITKKIASSDADYFELKDKNQLTEKLFERIVANTTCIGS